MLPDESKNSNTVEHAVLVNDPNIHLPPIWPEFLKKILASESNKDNCERY